MPFPRSVYLPYPSACLPACLPIQLLWLLCPSSVPSSQNSLFVAWIMNFSLGGFPVSPVCLAGTIIQTPQYTVLLPARPAHNLGSPLCSISCRVVSTLFYSRLGDVCCGVDLFTIPAFGVFLSFPLPPKKHLTKDVRTVCRPGCTRYNCMYQYLPTKQKTL